MKNNYSFLFKSFYALLLSLFSIAGWGQSETLNCPLGTIVSDAMTFNTPNFTIIHEKGSDPNFAVYTPWRVYTNNTVTFTGGAGVKRIISIVITAGDTNYATAAIAGSQTILAGTGTVSTTKSGSTATINISSTNVTSIRIKPNAQSRWSSIKINYEAAGCTSATVTTQPTSQSVMSNATATFTLAGTGTVQWQENTGSGWTNISNGGVYSGATTNTLSIANPPVSMNGYNYRAVLSQACDSSSANSNQATLSVTQYVGPWEDFEQGTKDSYGNGSVNCTAGNWQMNDALLGNDANDKKNGSKSVRLRNEGYIETNFDITGGVGVVKVSHAKYGSDANTSWRLLASNDGGATWSAFVSSTINTTNTSLVQETFTLNISGNVRLRIQKLAGGNRLNIDDIYITEYVGTPTLSVTPTSLSGFEATTLAASAIQTFSVSGTDLTGNVTLTAPADYEISTTDTPSFSAQPSITLTPTSGVLSATPIYVRLKSGAVGTYNGQKVIVSSTGATDAEVTLNGQVVSAPATSVKTGNWNDPTTWDINAVPAAGDNVIIAAGHTVSVNSSITRNAGTTTTVNGAFQINTGGYITGGAFIYDSSAKLNFNTTVTYGVNSDHVYWQNTNGPTVVHVLSGNIELNNISRTVNEIITHGGVNLNSSTLVVNQTAQINSGGYFSQSPTYGANSTLIYNTGTTSTYDVGNEWNAYGTAAGLGLPATVRLNNSKVLVPSGERAVTTAISLTSNSTLTLKPNSTVTTWGTMAINGGNTFELSDATSIFRHAGNWTLNSSGTFTPNGGLVEIIGTDTITRINGATTYDKLKINKTSGKVQLYNNIIIKQNIDFTSSPITLSTYNLTLLPTATISNANVNSYAHAAGAGKFIRQGVSTSNALFPVGVNDSGRYEPITLRTTSGTTELGVNLSTTVAPAFADNTKTVNLQWNVSSSDAVDAVVNPSWIETDQGANMINPGPGVLANYVTDYTFYPVTLAQYTTSASNVALVAGDNKIVVADSETAIKLPNDECETATIITVDAAPVLGTNKGSTAASGATQPSCSSSTNSRDVWYKFTTSEEGWYKVSVFKLTGTGAMSNPVLELRSGDCTTSTAIECSNGTGDEHISMFLNAATTYYYRVVNTGAATTDGTFTTSVTTIPTLVAAPTSLDFGTLNSGDTPTSLSFELSGYLLKNAPSTVAITAPTGFEVSLDNSTFATTVNLPYVTTNFAAVPVYVKPNVATACGETIGNITFAGGEVETPPTVEAKVNFVVPTTVAHEVDEADITENSFVASWDAVPGATGYELEVYKKKNIITETFTWAEKGTTNGTGGNDSEGYNGGSIAGGNFSEVELIGWIVGNGFKANNSAKLGTGSKQGSLTTPEFGETGLAVVKFRAAAWDGTNEKLNVNLSVIGGGTPSITQVTLTKAVWNTYELTISGVTPTTKLKIESNVEANSRFFIDDIVVDVYDFVTGYDPKIIVGGSTTSEVVTGLEEAQTYYYRVRAITSSCVSPNSNEVEVTTAGDAIWEDQAWRNNVKPSATRNAIIRDVYTVGDPDRPNFVTKNITVEPTGEVVIKANHHVIVHGVLTTEDDKIVVESDGNLVQKPGSTIDLVKNKIIVKRQLDLTEARKEYIFMGSPVYNQNMKALIGGNTANTPYATVLRESTNKYVNASASDYATVAKGFSIKETIKNPKDLLGNPVADNVAVFKGTVNNGTYSIPLAYSGATNIDAEFGFNVVGNPYPSNIHLDDVYALSVANGSPVSATFEFWDNKANIIYTQMGTGYTGLAYAMYNAVSGVGAQATGDLAGYMGVAPDGTVKVGQGFLTKADEAGTSLFFNNSVRTEEHGSSVFYGKQNKTKDVYHLYLETPDHKVIDNAVVYFDNGNLAFGVEDSKAQLGSDALYTLAEDTRVGINGRSTFFAEDKVKVGAVHYAAGAYKLKVGATQGIFANGQNIYLKDKLTGAFVDLSQGEYSFVSEAGEFDNRFEIVYKPEATLGVTDTTKESIQVYKDGAEIVVKADKAISNVEVYDAAGRLVMKVKADFSEVRIDNQKLVDGMYILKAEMRDSQIFSKKFRK